MRVWASKMRRLRPARPNLQRPLAESGLGLSKRSHGLPLSLKLETKLHIVMKETHVARTSLTPSIRHKFCRTRPEKSHAATPSHDLQENRMARLFPFNGSTCSLPHRVLYVSLMSRREPFQDKHPSTLCNLTSPRAPPRSGRGIALPQDLIRHTSSPRSKTFVKHG